MLVVFRGGHNREIRPHEAFHLPSPLQQFAVREELAKVHNSWYCKEGAVGVWSHGQHYYPNTKNDEEAGVFIVMIHQKTAGTFSQVFTTMTAAIAAVAPENSYSHISRATTHRSTRERPGT